eukprot:CAMPEP_0203764244 /NCGR_PEP_ID=MMETSP0098-20131031/17544_1 /ASSEMBLY_ACC=CAM_ASM_000208 /TAXON_ID=96639 /ORGANISM=" , Strain NY0313808BC1" /LENGTH=455 /DNA_ID=CAMNT_0050660017 /DNA_START=97 /DNA_END=1461 /DNA_ORIENTATION=+
MNSSKVFTTKFPEELEEAGQVSSDGDLHPRRGRLIGFIVNLVNSVVGAGILSLSFSIASLGWMLGCIMLLVCALLVNWSLHLLNKIANRIKGDQLSFGYIASRVDKWTPLLADVFAILMAISYMIIYLGTAGEYLVDVVLYFSPDADLQAWYMSRTFYLTVCWAALGVPLSLPRKVTAHQFTSGLAMVCMGYVVILVCVYATKPVQDICATFLQTHNATECFGQKCCVDAAMQTCCIGKIASFDVSFVGLIKSIPIMLSAYSCSPQLLSCYNDLRKPTVARLALGSSLTIGSVFLMYTAVAVAGYWTYGHTVSDNVLNSYPRNLPVTIGRIGIAFLVSVSYPLWMFTARDSLVHIVVFVAEVFNRDYRDPFSRAGKVIYYSVIVFLLLLTYAIGLAGLDMSFLFILSGSIATSHVTFTLPAYFYWALFKDEGYSKTRMTCPLLAFLGVFVMVVNL